MLDLPRLRDLLQPIVGEPLSSMFRAAGQVFEFGERRPATNRRGEPITVGDFALKFLTADWRIVQEGRIVYGSSDHTDNEHFLEETAPETPYDAEVWRQARVFLQSVEERTFVVESVEVDPLADVQVRLSHGLVIQSFSSLGQDFDIWWFHNRRTDVSCLVGPSGEYFSSPSPALPSF